MSEAKYLFIYFRACCISFPVNPLFRYFAHISFRVLIFLWISKSSSYFWKCALCCAMSWQIFSPTCHLSFNFAYECFFPQRKSDVYVAIQALCGPVFFLLPYSKAMKKPSLAFCSTSMVSFFNFFLFKIFNINI